MRSKVALLAVPLGVLLLLGGCYQPPPSPQENEILVTYQEPRTLVHFEVLGPKADKYVWDFGDGEKTETTNPKTFHSYSTPGIYVVSVEGHKLGSQGSGAPGPGMPGGQALLFRLEVVVDTRPAVEINGIEIRPIDPPYWYVPGAPNWPAWSFPANVALEFRVLFKFNRREEVTVRSVSWLIVDRYQRVIKTSNESEWIWWEATSDFRTAGCPGGPADYRVILSVLLSDDTVFRVEQIIRACPPGGCG